MCNWCEAEELEQLRSRAEKIWVAGVTASTEEKCMGHIFIWCYIIQYITGRTVTIF